MSIFIGIRPIIVSKIALLLTLFFCVVSNAQDRSWQIIPSPLQEDIKYVAYVDSSCYLLSGSNLFLWENDTWLSHKTTLPGGEQLFINGAGDIFINFPTKYQESEICFLQNETWISMAHPMVNKINCMYFIDRFNGVIGGLGEISLLENGQWKNIESPTFQDILSVLKDQENRVYALCTDIGLQYFDGTWHGIADLKDALDIKQHEQEIYVLTPKFVAKLKDGVITRLGFHPKLKKAISFDVVSENEWVVVGRDALLLHYKQGEWTQENVVAKDDLLSVVMNSNSQGICVGENGLMLGYGLHLDTPKVQQKWKGFEAFRPWGYAKMIDDEYGVVIADFNKDKKADVFTCGLFESENLYINKGNFTFSNEAESFGLNKKSKREGNSYQLGACAGDIDNDGDLDLYIGHLNGKNVLMKNVKGKTFKDISKLSHGTGEEEDRTNACIMGDVDNDGDLDIFVLNEYSSNRLFLNNGVGIFEDVTVESGLETEGGGMCASFGDLDDDGDIDLYISNWSTANKVYLNRWIERAELFFEDKTLEAGVGGDHHTKSNGVQLNDIDNDGDLDIFVTNRKYSNKLYINDSKGIFQDKTEALIGKDSLKSNGVLIEDFDGDLCKDIYISNVGSNTFYKGQKDGTFKMTQNQYGLSLGGYSTGVAMGDLDRDLDYDLYVANYIDAGSQWYKNNLNEKRFMSLVLKGFRNNRFGVGSKIYTFRAGHLNDMDHLLDFRQITAGQGYASMNELESLIPVSNEKMVDVRVEFPNGIRVVKRMHNTNDALMITDVEGWSKYMSLLHLFIKRSFLNPHILFKILKAVVVFILLTIFIYISKRRYKWQRPYSMLFGLMILCLYFIQSYYFEYEPLLYSTVLPFISILAVLVIAILINERRWIKLMAFNQQNDIRDKLARDLHDDLAATVSTTGIYLSLIKGKLGEIDPPLQNLFDQANKMISNAGSKISDLVWSIRSKEEKMEQFILRIQMNFSDLFYEKGIQFNLNIEENIKNIIIASEVKQNLYLILKEALNNIIKHAQANKVILEFKKAKGHLVIELHDDGSGFHLDKVKGKGYGLTNMDKRASDIGAELMIESEENRGTVCKLKWPISNLPPVDTRGRLG